MSFEVARAVQRLGDDFIAADVERRDGPRYVEAVKGEREMRDGAGTTWLYPLVEGPDGWDYGPPVGSPIGPDELRLGIPVGWFFHLRSRP